MEKPETEIKENETEDTSIESIIPATYINAKLKEILLKNESIGRNYKIELKKITLCFVQYLIFLASQISKEKGDREITRKHIELALEESNFDQIVDKIKETYKNKASLKLKNKKVKK